MMQFPQYESYKDSGIEWLGEIPEHWNTKELKYMVDINLSNVDKNIYSYEQDILLCNYLDVYNNDYISSKITFSKGSAKKEEVEKFSLVDGDILITKDSEDCNDIAIPALVTENLENVLCGYHLAILRNNKSNIYSPYLFFFLKSTIVSSYFSCRANGVTRYGISSGTIKNINTILPTIAEQKRIADFLKKKTTEIDKAIAKKQKLIELLQEQKAILINRAVTKGLNPNVPMRDSGIEWIGEIPEHWNIVRVKDVFDNLNNQRVPLSAESRGKMTLRLYDYYGASGIIDKVDRYLFDEDLIIIAEDGANLVLRNLRLALIATGKYWVNNHAHILKPKSGDLYFLCEALECVDYNPFISGAAQPKLTKDALNNVHFPIPSKSEQVAISNVVKKVKSDFETKVSIINKEISLFRELRLILISNAVTGKIKI